MSSASLTRVALYVRDTLRIAAFYEEHFGFRRTSEAADKIVLSPSGNGCAIVILQASRGHRIGQSCVKLVFDVSDVGEFKAERLKAGLKFGAIHRGPGYEFSNARDPARNLVQISNSFLRDERAP